MGQLEKYGLYVMCLVIFLILGVSLWDVGDPPSSSKQTPALTEVANKPAPSNAAAGGDPLMVDSLFKPTERPTGRDGKPPSKQPAGDAPRPDVNAKEASADKTTPPSTEPAKPAADSKRPTYKVRDGDTFESIAKSKLGSAALRTEIEKLNPGVKPTRLRLNQEIVLPSAADLASRNEVRSEPAPLAGGDRLYTVKKGDTFERIAAAQLGDKRRVDELRDLNPGIEDTKLREGKSLKLPKK